MKLFQKLFVVAMVSMLEIACASTGRKLADISAPNTTLLIGAERCGMQQTAEARQICIQGVEAEKQRTIETARAAAEAEKNRPVVVSGYPYANNYGYSTYNYGGYRSGGFIPYNQRRSQRSATYDLRSSTGSSNNAPIQQQSTSRYNLTPSPVASGSTTGPQYQTGAQYNLNSAQASQGNTAVPQNTNKATYRVPN